VLICICKDPKKWWRKWVTSPKSLGPPTFRFESLTLVPICICKDREKKDFYKAAFRSNNLHSLLSSFRHDARLERNQFVFTMIICNMISLCGWWKVKIKHQWENKQGIVCMIYYWLRPDLTIKQTLTQLRGGAHWADPDAQEYGSHIFLYVLIIPKGPVHQGGLSVVHQVRASGPLFRALKAASLARQSLADARRPQARKLSSSSRTSCPQARYDGLQTSMKTLSPLIFVCIRHTG
jgi:hypothetical protein